MENEGMTLESAAGNFNGNIISYDKKSRFIFSLITGLAYWPFLFLCSLPIFKRISPSPFGSLYELILSNYRTAGDILFVAIFSSFLFFLVVVLSIFLVFKNLSYQNSSSIFYQLPVRYVIVLSPIIFLYVSIAILSLVEGGESGLGAIYASVLIFGALFSILPILLLSSILYLWIKEKKIFSATIYFSVLIPLTFIGANLFNKSCWPGDSVCMSEQALKSNNPDLCSEADDSNSCFSYLAFVTGDSSYCERDSRMASSCYERVAVKNKDIDICERDHCQSKGCRDSCYAKVYDKIAQETLDLSLCDKAASYKWSSGESRINLGVCYATIAKNRDDSSICDKLQGKRDTEVCYWDFAIYKEDCSLVENIPDKKESCQSIVDYKSKNKD